MVIQVEVVVYIWGIRDHLLVVVVDQKIMVVIKLIHILIMIIILIQVMVML